MSLFGGIFGTVAKVGLNVAGSLLSSKYANDQSHENAMEQLEKNIEWQREQLKNKHQWETEDLKNAGLNPILSANSAAGGASSAGTVGEAPYENPLKNFKELQLLTSQIDNLNADSAKKVAEAGLAVEQAQTQPVTRANLLAQSQRDAAQATAFGSQARNLNANSARTEMQNNVLTASPELVRAQMRGEATGKPGGALSIMGDTLGQTFNNVGKWIGNHVFNSGRFLDKPSVPSSKDNSAKPLSGYDFSSSFSKAFNGEDF